MNTNQNSNIINTLNKNIEYLNDYKDYVCQKSVKHSSDNLAVLSVNYKINVLQAGLEIVKSFPNKIITSKQLFLTKNKDKDSIDDFFFNTLDYIIEYNKYEVINDTKFIIYQNNKINNQIKKSFNIDLKCENAKNSEDIEDIEDNEDNEDNDFVILGNNNENGKENGKENEKFLKNKDKDSKNQKNTNTIPNLYQIEQDNVYQESSEKPTINDKVEKNMNNAGDNANSMPDKNMDESIDKSVDKSVDENINKNDNISEQPVLEQNTDEKIINDISLLPSCSNIQDNIVDIISKVDIYDDIKIGFNKLYELFSTFHC